MARRCILRRWPNWSAGAIVDTQGNVLAEHDGMGLPLKPEHQVAFELRETDAGAVCVTRRELETWLAWKSAGDSRWIKTEVGAAVVAAILAVFAWLLPLK